MSDETYAETLFSLYPKPLELIEWQEKEITNLTSWLNSLRAKLEAAEKEIKTVKGQLAEEKTKVKNFKNMYKKHKQRAEAAERRDERAEEAIKSSMFWLLEYIKLYDIHGDSGTNKDLAERIMTELKAAGASDE